ncbi:MAG: hypothetical protein WCS20_05580 [Alphaproteobacteria bacterium]|jgi:hypothetical protein
MTSEVARQAIAAAIAASSAEDVVQASMAVLWSHLGDRQAHLIAGALGPDQHQFFVAGAFFVTPGRLQQMLVGNTGFPADQKRLRIPIDGGHPGQVIAKAAPLLLKDTREHTEFRQYLRTARMGSAVYAPLVWDGAAQGLLIMAAQAGGTMRQQDLDAIIDLAPVVAREWCSRGGPDWLKKEYEYVAQQ